MKKLFKHSLILMTLVFINQASAVDGVIELNQTCAVQTGCFTGDLPGFPIRISSPVPALSFILTSDIILPDEKTTGIFINLDNITIDFNGFSIVRQACYQQFCTILKGFGAGVSGGIFVAGITIKNGSIIGTGGSGISFNSSTHSIHVENMRVSLAGSHGIGIGDSSSIIDNELFENMGDGIFTRIGSYVKGNTIYSNNGRGIFAISSLIYLNPINDNGNDGIVCSNACNIKGNTIYNNTGDGIEVPDSSLTTQGAIIQDNNITGNDGFGIKFINSRSAYKGNFITNNFSGTISGTGFDLGQNFCTSNDTCP